MKKFINILTLISLCYITLIKSMDDFSDCDFSDYSFQCNESAKYIQRLKIYKKSATPLETLLYIPLVHNKKKFPNNHLQTSWGFLNNSKIENTYQNNTIKTKEIDEEIPNLLNNSKENYVKQNNLIPKIKQFISLKYQLVAAAFTIVTILYYQKKQKVENNMNPIEKVDKTDKKSNSTLSNNNSKEDFNNIQFPAIHTIKTIAKAFQVDTEHNENLLIELKKNSIKRLNKIAGLSEEEFRLVTIEELEAIFLPNNLDLINNLYTTIVCSCCENFEIYGEKYKPYRNTIYTENTLLSLACKYDSFVVIMWLLHHGADTNIRGERKNLSYIVGDSPLLHCLHLWHDIERLEQYLTLLLDRGANPNVFSHIDLLFRRIERRNRHIECKKDFPGTLIGRLLTNIGCGQYKGCKSSDYHCPRNWCHYHNPFAMHNCIKLLIKQGAILYHELYRISIDDDFLDKETFKKLCCTEETYNTFDILSRTYLFRAFRCIASIYEELLFEGFDPNNKVIDKKLPPLLSAIIHERIKVTKSNVGNDISISDFIFYNQLNLQAKGHHFKFARMLLSYGHITKNLIETYKETLMDKIILISAQYGYRIDQKNTDQFFNNFTRVLDILIDEEYEFRKSFFKDPQQKFIDIIKRCRRPELWIDRIGDEAGISKDQQNLAIQQICYLCLSLLHKTITKQLDCFSQKEKSKINKLSKMTSYMLDNLHQKKLLSFDRELKKDIENILLMSLKRLHEGNDSLYKEFIPLIEFCGNNPQYINLLKKKNDMSTLQFLAFGIDNTLLKNMLKNLKKNVLLLQIALKQPVTLAGFKQETHTTPLYIANELSLTNQSCEKTAKLFKKAELFVTKENIEFKKKYRHNPHIIDNTYTDKINATSLKGRDNQRYFHII